jgi:hypothetical protein
MKDGESRETGNIGYTRHKTTKTKNTTQYVLDTTICVGHHYMCWTPLYANNHI